METEQWRSVTWPILLERPPQIIHLGIGVHGQNQVEQYQLPDLWCLHLYRYQAVLNLDGSTFPIRPGHAGIVPADMPMEYHFRGRSPHLYVHFRLETAPGSKRTLIPAMQDLGNDFGRVYAQIEQIADAAESRAQARLWEILWQLAERAVPTLPDAGAAHPAVGRALAYIDRHLDEPLRVARIAQAAGVSDSYLARLFGEALDKTVVGYIRDRRVERAAHLLRHSTLPIKTIAASVGLPDLHQFNKVIHAALGCSPRAARRERQETILAKPGIRSNPTQVL